MDWAKVKTILIIVFLIVNIFLMMKVVEKSCRRELKADEIQSVTSLLSQNNIILQQQMPTKISFMPRIKTTNEIAEGDWLADKLIGSGKWTKVQGQTNETIYTFEDKKLKVGVNGRFNYTINKGPDKLQLNSEDKVKEYIYNILRLYTTIENYTLESLVKGRDGYELKLSCYYKDNEIFNNYVEAKVNDSGQIILTHGLVSFDGFVGKPKKVTPVDALIELIKSVERSSQTTVREVLLGYYADVNKNQEVIKYGEADPAWKIITDKGTYIFDGYNGSLLYESGVLQEEL